MFTVHQLRKNGFNVRVHHNRELLSIQTENGKDYDYNPRGGSTMVRVYDPQNGIEAFGHAYCSRKDNYNRKLGVRIALGRALKSLNALITRVSTADASRLGHKQSRIGHKQ